MIRYEKRETEYSCSKEDVFEIQKATGLSLPVARLLCQRGIRTPADAGMFLRPGPEQLFDPLLLPDMGASVGRIKKRLR